MADPKRRAILVHEVNQTQQVAGSASYIQPLVQMGGSQRITSGNPFNFVFQGPLNMVILVLDIPAGVTCDVSLDSNLIVSVADLQGLCLALPMGQLDRGIATRVLRTQIIGTNLSTASRDVRAWAVCIP